MINTFDAYHRWLGIPPEKQPPNHYSLLAIEPFEDDPNVIEHAADRQMAHLRTLQTGKHGQLTQKLLNEVATAKVCLLNAEKKAAYDRQLRKTLQPAAATGRPKKQPADKAAGQLSDGNRLGEYRLLEKLGEGGMGAVYKAMHTKLGREVAVKILPPGRIEDSRAIARFEREMMAVGRLDHVNIVRAHDAREIEGTRFLVMEYVDGQDLSEVVKAHGPLNVADACELIRQAALALQSAHENGLIHRDVKPSNLMLTADGTVKLLDLGLARFQHDQPAGEEMTATGQTVGTVDYMAPEQAFDTHAVDIRADVYSLGCTLYKLLTGRAPFADSRYQNAMQKLMAHAKRPVPPIRKMRGDVPKQLAAVINRMLAKDPKSRFSTPAEVADAVGPLATTADLLALAARARQLPAEGRPPRALEPTMASQSTGLTQFLQRMKPGSGSTPPPPPAETAEKSWMKPAIVAGSVLAGVLLVSIVVLVALKLGPSRSRPAPVQDAVLVFNWPKAERREVKLYVDGNRAKFPQVSGPIEYRCPPGDHDILAKREGYRPYEKTVRLEGGQRKEISPVWVRQSHLVLAWPQSQRRGAKLTLDGRPQDLTVSTVEVSRTEVKLPVDAGPHELSIVREGFQPYRQQIDVAAERDVQLTPVWKEAAPVVKPPPDAVAVVQPDPEKPSPDPSADPSDPKQPPKDPPPGEPAPPELTPAERQQLEAEARFVEQTAPAERMVEAWNFSGAQALLGELQFDDDASTGRLARRQDEVKRLAELKERIIAKINAANPPIKKTDLMLRGLNGTIGRAEQQGITAELITGKTETRPWADLGSKAHSRLMQLAIDRRRADDWVSGGLLALACKDPDLAEKLFAKAATMGVKIEVYLDPLASTAFARAKDLTAQDKFDDAVAALTGLQKKYGTTPWFASHKDTFAAALAKARNGVMETAADELYARAARFFEKKDLFDLKPLVHKLKGEYPQSTAVTDPARDPSFAAMEKAVEKLGRRLTVGKDGRADFTTIQEAISEAPPNSLIEILDAGPYPERILLNKDGITIRGKSPAWPVVTSKGAPVKISELVSVTSRGGTLQRLLLLHKNPAGSYSHVVDVRARADCRLRNVVGFLMNGNSMSGFSVDGNKASAEIDECVFISRGGLRRCTIRNTTWFIRGNHMNFASGCTFENCVFDGRIHKLIGGKINACVLWGDDGFSERPSVLSDSIVKNFGCNVADCELKNCNILAVAGSLPLGTKFMTFDPMFVNRKGFDYRLLPASPCKGKATDGGDLGVRYTPEMIEMLKVVAGLKSQGVINF